MNLNAAHLLLLQNEFMYDVSSNYKACWSRTECKRSNDPFFEKEEFCNSERISAFSGFVPLDKKIKTSFGLLLRKNNSNMERDSVK